MPNDYPYKKRYQTYLRDVKKQKQITILSYDETLYDFFLYLNSGESGYDPGSHSNLDRIEAVKPQDIHYYLDVLVAERNFKKSTINKTITILRGYFNFLYKVGETRNLPTVNLKYEATDQSLKRINYSRSVIEEKDKILSNEEIPLDCRMYLLLILKGVTIIEMISLDFYEKLNKLQFSPSEITLKEEYLKTIKPIQEKWNSKAIFFKSKIYKDSNGENSNVITEQSIYKRLKILSNIIGMKVEPRQIRRELKKITIEKHINLSDAELVKKTGYPYSTIIKLKEEIAMEKQSC